MNRLVRQALPDSSDSSTWFYALSGAAHRVFLDSAQPQSQRGRYDIISADPLAVIDLNSIAYKAKEKYFDKISQQIQHITQNFIHCADLPFCDGAIGLLSYELGESLLLSREMTENAGDFIGIYDWAIVVAHTRQTAELVSPPDCQRPYPARLFQTQPRSRIEQPSHLPPPLTPTLAPTA